MNAAVYARKSTLDERDSADQSVTRQVELARRFAAERDWIVPDDLVFVDNEVSATDWKNRIAWKALRAAADAGRFDRLVTMEQSRIARDQRRGPAEIAALEDASIEIWEYATNRRIGFDGDDDSTVMMTGLNSIIHTAERRNARRRTRETMRSMAEKGHVTGGVVYGYRNVEVRSGNKKRDHVVREIDPTQADVVRRIFTLSAAGVGLLGIAKRLNADRILSPSGRGWAMSGVREMLRRDLYRGVIVYGKKQRKDRGERKVKVNVPEAQWIRLPAEHLRIVSEDLWRRVHDRIERTKDTYSGRKANGQLQGRREAGLVRRYLLSGFLRCGVCGGNLIVSKRCNQKKQPGKDMKAWAYWICTTAHHRGRDICANSAGVPYERLTDAVVTLFKETIFNPVSLGTLLARELEEKSKAPEETKAELANLKRDLGRLEAETARLVEAIASGTGEVAPLADRVRANEGRKRDLLAQIEHLDGLHQAAKDFDVSEWFAETSELLADTRNLLEADAEAGRHLLRRCLRKPLKVTPDGQGGWTFEGEGWFAPKELRRVIERTGSDIILPAPGRGLRLENRELQGRIEPIHSTWCRERGSNPHGLAPKGF